MNFFTVEIKWSKWRVLCLFWLISQLITGNNEHLSSVSVQTLRWCASAPVSMLVINSLWQTAYLLMPACLSPGAVLSLPHEDFRVSKNSSFLQYADKLGAETGVWHGRNWTWWLADSHWSESDEPFLGLNGTMEVRWKENKLATLCIFHCSFYGILF